MHTCIYIYIYILYTYVYMCMYTHVCIHVCVNSVRAGETESCQAPLRKTPLSLGGATCLTLHL